MAPLLKTLQWWSGALGWEVLGSAQTLKPPAWSPLKSLFLAFMTGCSAFDQGPDHQPFSLKFKKKRQIDLGKQRKWGFCLRALLSFFFVLGYSQWTILCSLRWTMKGFSHACNMYLFSPKPTSHPGYHITWTEFHVLYNRSLLSLFFKSDDWV